MASYVVRCRFGFTPNPNCDFCDATGIAVDGDDDDGLDAIPCTFCLEDAILSGEIDGTINGIPYVGGFAAYQ